MALNILFLILGFALLIKGADWLVNGASVLAKKHHISDLAIGLTIVAFGTSAPELVVNTFASLQNHHAIVLGNIIGSNNFNIFFILGIVGIITPLVVQSSTVWKEIPLSFIAAIVLFVLANDFLGFDKQIISRIDATLLLLIFCFFLFYVYKNLKTETIEHDIAQHNLSTLKIVGLILVGFSGLVVGGKLVVNNAVQMATILGMSEKMVSLTIVAAGTSLPELATSVIAALKKNADIAVGNIIGSNIFNIFFVLGLSAMVKPVAYERIFNTDIYMLAGGTIILFLAMFTGKKHKLDRWEAAILFLIYIAYTLYLIKAN